MLVIVALLSVLFVDGDLFIMLVVWFLAFGGVLFLFG